MDHINFDAFPSRDALRSAFIAMDEIQIVPLSSENVDVVVDLLRRNLGTFDDVGSVLASSFRRIDNMMETYQREENQFFVAKVGVEIVGGAGLGSLAGLPQSEGIGEIRELVIDEKFRRKGIGKALLIHALKQALKIGYGRIYLETTPQMEHAQKLFKKIGFRPVEESPVSGAKKDKALPVYFLLEEISTALEN